jgi:hypothetical protein
MDADSALNIDSKIKVLGYFDDEVAAALAYNVEAVNLGRSIDFLEK